VAARESGWGRELVVVVTAVVIVAVMNNVLDWWKTVRGAGRGGELAQLRPGGRLLLLLLLLLVLMVLAVVVFVYDLTRQRVAVCGRRRSTETGEGLV